MTDADEPVDATPVLLDDPRAHEPQPVSPAGALTPAVVQTMAVVGASVVAGAAVMAVAQRRRTRKLARRQRSMLPIKASRSFLVDVHVLGERR